jgi:hypothetical protein
VAGVALAAAVPLNMWGWIGNDLIPIGDHAGYIAAIEQLWNNLVNYGRVPPWTPNKAGGVSHFTSDLKEFLALPFVRAVGPTRGYFLTLALCKILAAAALYAVVATLFRSPVAGLTAGYAYGFGAIANYRSGSLGHLDILLSYVLYPLILVVALKTLRTRWRTGPVLLGVLVALQLHISFLPGLLVPLMIALLWLLRPWQRASETTAPRPAAVDFWQQLRSLSLAVAVFAVLSTSQLAWLAFDTANHTPHEPARVEYGRERFVVHSPFQLINRANWLAPWLRNHGSEALRTSIARPHGGQGLYLGGFALVSIAVAAALLRHASSLRSWYAFFGILFAIQYWLAMGSHSLLGQLAATFQWPPSAAPRAGWALLAVAVGCTVAAAWLALRRGSRDAARRLLWAAVAAVAISTSAFDAVEFLLPLLRGVRAPGHFFDLAPFAFYAWFGVSLVAIERALRQPALRRGLAVFASLLVVLDYAPSRADHRGRAVAPLLEMADVLASLDAERPPARVGMILPSPTGNTHGSLAAALGGVSTAWNWPRWHAGPHWSVYYSHVHQNLRSMGGYKPPAELRDVLARLGRIRYFLHERSIRQPVSLPPPWRLISSNDRFALWEQPEILPPAFAVRSYGLAVGTHDGVDLWLSERLIPRGVALVSVNDLLAPEPSDLAQQATLLYAPDVEADALDPTLRSKLRTSAAQFKDLDIEARPLKRVGYARPAPENIALRFDARDEDAVVFVSESYHPWWRARVDGEPAPVLRAMSAFMAIRVGPGAHHVDLVFQRPPWVRSAEWLSRGGWAAVLLGSALYTAVALRARRGGPPSYQRPQPGAMASRGSRIG